ncbi:alpha/beta fold hydrolase [Paraburkholderia sp. J7]|uniref:alpha/beta fold hydrolase n=1 Tax=Paraburkholderia sp. J7 TaxID=2805438 RepID=UPI002AB7EA15|nr:alpha/beta fold hydrolase [Paraburkholderia sp. J7]
MAHLAPSAPAESIEALTLTCGPHADTALAAGPRSGECVLLLHDWPEFADCLRDVLAALGAAGYRTVAVDQRGRAENARSTNIALYTAAHLESDALEFADQTGATQFHLIAHDWDQSPLYTLHPSPVIHVFSLPER